MNPKMIFQALKKNSPAVLGAIASGGVALTGYFAYQAGKKDQEDLNWKQKAKNYILPVVIGVGSIICIAGAHRIHLNKEAAMAAAIAFYKAKGEDWEEACFDKFSDAGLEANVMTPNKDAPPYPSQIMRLKIWEPYTKQWITATQQEILWAELIANKMLQQKGYVTLNDILRMFHGYKKKRIGDKLGWSWEDEVFVEASGYYYSGGWIDMCPQWDNANGETRFILDYGINPSDISEFIR